MGKLIEGAWRAEKDFDPKKYKGAFQRADAQFRKQLGEDVHPVVNGRYHLYVSYACPWANRCLIFRKLKGLEDAISISVVDPYMGPSGWTFGDDEDGIPDDVNDVTNVYELYQRADPDYTGRVTVPILWDKEVGTIVNNESSEIIRMFNSAFDDHGAKPGDYYPQALRAEIDEVNARVYATVNNGVYKCGFANSQEAYNEAFDELFDSLDWLEDRLSKTRYLTGDTITEADWRLFVTLVRFDPVYVCHFKCNKKRITDYPNLWGFTKELYQWPGVSETVNLRHIKEHYFTSHDTVNPRRFVARGPDIDFNAPHGRG